MIEQGTIDRIFDAAQITEVVQEFVSLKRRGVNYLGNCPFHNEKTPSFTVSPAKNIFKCFGCGKGGNSVHFIMEHEHMTYYEALKYLAKKYNIEVIEDIQNEEDIQQKNDRESMLVLSTYAQKLFSENLFHHLEGKSIGLSYFKERGFREDIIKNFELGYCFEERDAFTKKALKDGYKLEYLVKTGLTIEGEHGSFDRFSGRVMFPIHNLTGKVIAFGGRILKSDKKIAKYLNSPESDIYHKSKVLYGIYQARKAIMLFDKCYLVEGYTDVISMHQAGIENVVASSGTSLTDDQIRLIKRFTPNVTILYDGDAAGIKASLRGIDMVLEEGLNVKVLLLPDGEDPDSFSKKLSATELNDYLITHQTDFITFKTNLLLKDAENDPIKKASVINDMVKSISIIPDAITRSVYIRECSKLLDTDENVLYTEINKLRRNKNDSRNTTRNDQKSDISSKPKTENDAEFNLIEVAEKEIIRILLSYGNEILYTHTTDESFEQTTTVSEYIIQEILHDELNFSNSIYQNIFDVIRNLSINKQTLEEKYFTQHSDSALSRSVIDLLTSPHNLSKIWKRNETFIETEDLKLKAIVPECLLAFKSKKVQALLKETESLLLKAQQEKNQEEVSLLQQKYMTLTTFKKELSKNLGNRIII
jgi:DNA primase